MKTKPKRERLSKKVFITAQQFCVLKLQCGIFVKTKQKTIMQPKKKKPKKNQTTLSACVMGEIIIRAPAEFVSLLIYKEMNSLFLFSHCFGSQFVVCFAVPCASYFGGSLLFPCVYLSLPVFLCSLLHRCLSC